MMWESWLAALMLGLGPVSAQFDFALGVSSAVPTDVGSPSGLSFQPGYRDPRFMSMAQGRIDDALGATYSEVERTNREIREMLTDLVATDYFRYYKADLWSDQCPFKDDGSGMCGNRACAVEPVEDESELPEFWRSQYLGGLAQDSFLTSTSQLKYEEDLSDSCVLNDGSVNSRIGKLDTHPMVPALLSDDLNNNYCLVDDESVDSPGVYVSLVDNPERFTGYAGSHAHKVWRAVYQENCFEYKGEPMPTKTVRRNTGGLAASQLSRVIMDLNRYEMREVGGQAGFDAMNQECEQCMEQRIFYRVLSGMHASVSTHLCFEYLNKTTGEWSPNLDCFMSRVGNHPERLSNLYLNYALVSRAVAKLRRYVSDLYFCREDEHSDLDTRRQLLRLAKKVSEGRHVFNETLAFSSPEAQALKAEFRKRFRNVSKLMNCVGCDRCKLWGKLQVAGYGTALKILFELPERPELDLGTSNRVLSSFKRSELVALVNLFNQLSKSIEAVEYFRDETRRDAGVTSAVGDDYYENYKRKPVADTPTWEWDPEWDHAWRAIKFVLRSYIDFPKNLWRLFIAYSNFYWNRFIGRDDLILQEQRAFQAKRLQL